ncbi:MAG: LOG family protein [Puniceicoccales bacterium]|jgi:uncharacterized protein (TIGR00730 family)|nr:LOG family protein [Puniceicoccales bacterium]
MPRHVSAHTFHEPGNPPKAYENLDFIKGSYGRHVRVLCEFTEPLQRMNKYRIRNTVVFYGSARILSEEKAQLALREAREAASKLLPAEGARLLEKAERALEFSAYYEAARQLAEEITRWSKTLPKSASPFYICSGGGPGIMEAANRGASEAGGITLGLGISLPYEQHNNPYVTQGLGFEFHYFFIRKYWFVTLAKALVIFPGGFGTMDEMFELLTLVQTRKLPFSPPIVLFGSKFWAEVLNFEVFKKWGLIDDVDLGLFHIVDTVEDALDFILPHLERLNYAPPYAQENDDIGE